MQNENEKIGTDLRTVLRAEADDLPMEVTEEEMTMMQQYAGTEEDSAKALLRESRNHTQLLMAIEKYTLVISTMMGFLVALGVCGFVILCINLFR